MPMADYHSDPCHEPSVSRSFIFDCLNESPLHAAMRHPRIGGKKDGESTPEASIGTVAHDLLLQGEGAFAICPFDDYRTNAAKDWKAQTIAQGKTPIKAAPFAAAEEMVKSFRKNFTLERFPELQEGFPTSNFEKTLITKINGVYVKVRFDAINSHLWDYKTTGAGQAHPDNWTRNQLFHGGLDIQAALYQRAWHSLFGEKKHFIFAVQEQTEPFDCYPVTLDESALGYANERINRVFDIFKRGMDSGQWDGYATRIVTATTPQYLVSKWEEDKERIKTLDKIKAVENDNVTDLRAAG